MTADRLTPEREAKIRRTAFQHSMAADVLRELDAVRDEYRDALADKPLPAPLAAALDEITESGIDPEATEKAIARAIIAETRAAQLEAALRVRISAGHNDTCGSQLVLGHTCTCGHFDILAALAASPARCTCGVAAIGDAPVEPMPHAPGCPGGGSES